MISQAEINNYNPVFGELLYIFSWQQFIFLSDSYPEFGWLFAGEGDVAVTGVACLPIHIHHKEELILRQFTGKGSQNGHLNRNKMISS